MNTIYLISEAYSSIHKGTAVHTHSIARTLDEMDSNYNYVLIVPKYLDSDEKYYIFNKIKVVALEVKVNSDVGLLDKKAREDFILQAELYLNKMKDIHIIHVLYGHYIHSAIKNIKAKKIWTCHNVPPNEYPDILQSSTIGSKCANYLYHKAVAIKHRKLIKSYTYNSIIAISSFTESELRRIDEKIKIDVIGNGIIPIDKSPIQPIRDSNNTIKILTIGGIKSHKYVHLIPDIAKRLGDNFNIEWNVVGPIVDNKYYDSFRENISDPVRFTGKIDQVDLNRYMSDANIYVHTSNMEGFCLTVLEANLLGKPVVGTNVGAIPEVINSNKSGVVCEPTVESLASGISHLITNMTEFDSSKISQSTMKKWSWEVICRKLEDVYNGYE